MLNQQTKQTSLPHKGTTLWLTGLSGAGKSTIAEQIKRILEIRFNIRCKVLDGDLIRKGLNKDLGFSSEDRTQNLRRIAETALLFNQEGFVTIVAFISPYQRTRQMARKIHSDAEFKVVYVATSLEVCEERDVKGLYKKAREGIIPSFTGVSDVYQVPQDPDVKVETRDRSPSQCSFYVIEQLGIVREREVMVGGQVVEGQIEGFDVTQTTLEWVNAIEKGWISPLNNFMSEEQVFESINFRQISVGSQRCPFSIPIVCCVECDQARQQQFKQNKTNIKLRFNGYEIAVIRNATMFKLDIKDIRHKIFSIDQTTKHPGAEHHFTSPYALSPQRIISINSNQLKQALKSIQKHPKIDPQIYQKYSLTPTQIIQKANKISADAIIGFQLRNPLHNGHLKILKDAQSTLKTKGYKNPIILLHPLSGWTKQDDVPLNIRLRQHQILIEENELQNCILATWPIPMFYAGPVEVVWHVASRMNCAVVTHFVVGRDPAGIKINDENVYDASHGIKMLQNHRLLKNKIQIIPFKQVKLSKSSNQMVFVEKQHKSEDYYSISGSELRQAARGNKVLPKGYMNQKAWEYIRSFYCVES